MDVLFIHGAGASKKSFNWIVPQIECNAHFYSYDMNTSNISSCIADVHKEIDSISDLNTKRTVIVVGHSLGGLIAAGVANNPFVSKIVTISTPLGGILLAGLFGLFNTHSMTRDLLPYSAILTEVKNQVKAWKKPHKAIISTQGLPFLLEQNDGVVQVNSQMAWDTPEYEKFNLNHFEVLMDDEVLKSIKEFITR